MPLNLNLWPAAQSEFVNAPQRYLGFFAGRRFGKSYTLAARAKKLAVTRPGFRYWYVAPLYAQVIQQFENEFLADVSFAPRIKKTKLQPYPRIFLRNGSVLGFRSAERMRSLRGFGLDEVDVDEIQDIPAEDFWPVIRPLISDRFGTLAVAGQFRGQNWYYDEFFKKAQDPANTALYRSWRCPSREGWVYQGDRGRAELVQAQAQVPQFVWRVEYECDPLSNLKAALDPDDVEKIFDKTVAVPPGPREGHRYIAGVDLGRVKDHTAVVVLEVKTGLICHVEVLPRGQKHELQAPQVARICNHWNALPIIDCTGGATGGHQPLDAHLQYYKKCLPRLKPFWWSKNKENVCKHLILQVEQSKLKAPGSFAVYPQFKQLRSELLAYEVDPKRGYYDFHAGDGFHDDTVAALAQAAWGQHMGWNLDTGGAPLSSII